MRAGVLTFVLASAVIFGQEPILRADPPAATTTITIPDMDCAECAKSITGRLKQVPGVASVQINLKAAAAFIVAQPGRALSPRGLWEAVEQAGYRPTRLQGPQGTFTTKPQS